MKRWRQWIDGPGDEQERDERNGDEEALERHRREYRRAGGLRFAPHDREPCGLSRISDEHAVQRHAHDRCPHGGHRRVHANGSQEVVPRS